MADTADSTRIVASTTDFLPGVLELFFGLLRGLYKGKYGPERSKYLFHHLLSVMSRFQMQIQRTQYQALLRILDAQLEDINVLHVFHYLLSNISEGQHVNLNRPQCNTRGHWTVLGFFGSQCLADQSVTPVMLGVHSYLMDDDIGERELANEFTKVANWTNDPVMVNWHDKLEAFAGDDTAKEELQNELKDLLIFVTARSQDGRGLDGDGAVANYVNQQYATDYEHAQEWYRLFSAPDAAAFQLRLEALHDGEPDTVVIERRDERGRAERAQQLEGLLASADGTVGEEQPAAEPTDAAAGDVSESARAESLAELVARVGDQPLESAEAPGRELPQKREERPAEERLEEFLSGPALAARGQAAPTPTGPPDKKPESKPGTDQAVPIEKVPLRESPAYVALCLYLEAQCIASMVDIDDIVRFAASIDAGGFAERHSFPKETVEEARTGYLSAIGDAVRYVRYELGTELGTETGADEPGPFATDVLVPYFNMLNCMARWREIIHETEKELVDLGKRVADRFQQTYAAPDTRTPGGEGILWEYTGRIRGSEYSFWADYSLRLPAGLNEVLKGAGSNIRIVEERDLQDHYQIKIFELTGGGGFIERTVGRPGADNTILRRFLQFGSEIHDRSHIVEEGLIRNILTEKKGLVALGARGYWWTSKLVRKMKSEQEAAARILLLRSRKSDPAHSLVRVLTGDNIVGLLGRDFKEYPTKAHRTAQLKRCRMIFQEGLRSYRPRLSHLFDYGAAAYLKEGAEGPLPRTSLLGLVEWLAYYHADMHTEESFRFILRRVTTLLRRDMAEQDGYSKSQLREYVNRQTYRRFISGSYGDSGLE